MNYLRLVSTVFRSLPLSQTFDELQFALPALLHPPPLHLENVHSLYISSLT